MLEVVAHTEQHCVVVASDRHPQRSFLGGGFRACGLAQTVGPLEEASSGWGEGLLRCSYVALYLEAGLPDSSTVLPELSVSSASGRSRSKGAGLHRRDGEWHRWRPSGAPDRPTTIAVRCEGVGEGQSISHRWVPRRRGIDGIAGVVWGVAGVGVEPTSLSAPRFEPGVSASSTIRPWCSGRGSNPQRPRFKLGVSADCTTRTGEEMSGAGLEPACSCEHCALNAACLPDSTIRTESAQGGTRTLMSCDTSPSGWRVYRFHHLDMR